VDSLPEPARGIAAALTAALAAARGRDLDSYRAAVEELGALNPEQVGLVAGETVRLLVEDAHPGGLTADDARAIIETCARDAAWYPDLDPTAVTILLAGALGIHESEGQPIPLAADTMAAHAPLLLASLGPHTDAALRAALAQIATTQIMELP